MTDTPKRPRGRPSKYTDDLANEIIERLSKGEPLAQICRDDHMPGAVTVYEWQKVKPEFSERFARAREIGFDVIATECLDIAEDGSRDYTTKTRPDGSEYEAFDAEHVQRSKLRVETRLKLLAKWDPKRYGERQTVDLNAEVVTYSPEQRAARIAELLAKANGSN